ncbi:DUF1178 family protein [Azospirillum sp. TSO35-2]|uniref:DUF1178 family protein n=1 Tax=Azospirillum sp. TSO35-2 TaxID=716796 RepID=UPI000D6214F5|nr:DUF1178 family protein [Azospirillum sp. TSO35-2]PWC33200.1 hypothetical protein TSO352_22000 [Azospirillum sp. TSO35-2]
MIVYALRCACGHEFDQWFDNMADYDTKKSAGIACPSCNGTDVAKAIMAPRVGKTQAAPPAPACAPGGCGGGGGCPMMSMM